MADILAHSMSQPASKRIVRTPQEQLAEINFLVRNGLPEPGTFKEQQERTIGAIRDLKRQLIASPNILDDVDQMRLLMFEAEFQQYCGQFENAARILEPTWKQLKPQLDAWSLKRPLGPKDNMRLLRQRIWVLMHYVFYADYLLAGNHQQALDRLLLLKKIVWAELATPKYCPHGTLAVCHYFIGRCHRVSREFREAEENLVLAQRWMYDRASRELCRPNLTPWERKYEQAFKDVYTARFLSGLAWVTMHRGQLLRSEQFL